MALCKWGTAETAGTLGTANIQSNGGFLAFNRTDTVSLTQNISGNAGLAQNGTGTLLVMSSNNTYTGDTIVNAGTMRFE